MTDYHQVTKEELEQIRELAYNDSCITISRMIDSLLSRPDPIALLEKWREWYAHKNTVCNYVEFWYAEVSIIDRLRTNPEVVLKELKEKGVWKE